jgi:hypothetical protein
MQDGAAQLWVARSQGEDARLAQHEPEASVARAGGLVHPVQAVQTIELAL